MDNFEMLYSLIENKYKDKLKALKFKAASSGVLSYFVFLIVLMIFILFLYEKMGSQSYPTMMISVAVLIPLFFISRVIVSSFIKKKNFQYQTDKEKFFAYYFDNIVVDFIKERYGFNISNSGDFDKALLEISDIFLAKDSITYNYDLTGFSPLKHGNPLEIYTLITDRFESGPDARHDFVHSLFAVIECDDFSNFDLKITNNQEIVKSRKDFTFINSNNINIPPIIFDYLRGLDRRISITIRNSCLYMCLHNCHDMSFNDYNGKRILKNLCTNLDLTLQILDSLKTNLKASKPQF